MTYMQIEKTKAFMTRLEKINGLLEMNSFVGELKSFYLAYDVTLDIDRYNTLESYTIVREYKDKASIRSFLDSQIAENDINRKVWDVLVLIDEGNNTIDDDKQMTEFVSKVYFSYNDKIKFDETTEIVATAPSDLFSLSMYQADKNMVAGIINKLKDYGMSLLSQPSTMNAKINPQLVINNTNTATASTTVNVSVSIEQAKQQIEDAGLSDAQYKDVMGKLVEIESIGISTDTKGSKWKKAKEILKWCAEQGIEIAKIILPLLPQMFDK